MNSVVCHVILLDIKISEVFACFRFANFHILQRVMWIVKIWQRFLWNLNVRILFKGGNQYSHGFQRTLWSFLVCQGFKIQFQKGSDVWHKHDILSMENCMFHINSQFLQLCFCICYIPIAFSANMGQHRQPRCSGCFSKTLHNLSEPIWQRPISQIMWN